MPRAACLAGAVLALAIAAPAFAHPERHAFFPDGSVVKVPTHRSSASQVLTVCTKDSKARIKRSFKGTSKALVRKRKLRLRQLRRCGFRNTQAAVNKARNGAIIRIMPGAGRHGDRDLRRRRRHRPRQLDLRQLARRGEAALRPGGVPRRAR
jgi:hypothetical protein